MTIFLKTKIFMLGTVMIFFCSSICCSAPVGNLGDPGIWEDGLFVTNGFFHIFVSAEYDRQRYTLPNQKRLEIWKKPKSDETRHYAQIRSSENQFSCSGIKVGTSVTDSWVLYFLTGVCSSRIDYYYSDQTVNYAQNVVSNVFKSDADLYYGIGTSAIMHETLFMDKLPLKFGIDLKFRTFDLEDDSLSYDGTFYSATIREFQAALIMSADTGLVHPYIGARISNTTGKEHYKDINFSTDFFNAGFIDYKEDITVQKNVGYVAGLSFYLKKTASLNIETRFGDEDGLGFYSTVRF